MLAAVLGKQYKGRRRGIAIRSGAVRQARLEAGLSLAQVADGELTRAAIHQVETGRVRPSIDTLRLIARRTGRPVEFFLPEGVAPPPLAGPEADLAAVERLVATRDFQLAIESGLPLLERPLAPRQMVQLRFNLGQSYCRLVQPSAALAHLAAARAAFERLGDDWMAVEALDWEAAARGLLEDPRALSLAQEALDRCRRLDPRPAATEVRILGHLAGMHVARHAWREAIGCYELAVAASGNVKDLLQLAKMHHGLGTAYQRLEQPDRAQRHFDRALALYALESDLAAVYRVENDLGELLIRQGQLAAAREHLDVALRASDELRIDRRGRGYILANLGEIALLEGRSADARRHLEEALAAGEALGEQLVVGNALVQLGRLEERCGHRRLANRRFTAALEIFRDLEMPARLLECHMAFAELLEARGDLRGAAEHWKRAAELGRSASLGLAARSETRGSAAI